MLKNWLKIYWYNTMKHKMYFLLTVVGLAIGIASVVLASLYYLEESSYDQWNPHKDEVYIIETVVKDDYAMTYQFEPIGRHLKDNYSELEDYMYFYTAGTLELRYNDKVVSIEDASLVQDNFFEFFPFDMVYGNAKQALVNPDDVALDIKLAESLFGRGVNPVGKEIEVVDFYDPESKKNKYTITAVYEIGDKRSSMAPSMIRNSLTNKVKTSDDWSRDALALCVKTKYPDKIKQAIVSLRDKYVIEPNAEKQGKTLAKFREEDVFNFYTGDIVLHRLSDCRMTPKVGLFFGKSANVQMLNLSVYLSITILLLSIFNYVNLSLTQVMRRGKEMGMRKVIGASKTNLYKQSLLESAIVVVIAMILAICSIEAILPFINVYLETTIVFSFIKDLLVLVVIALVIIFVCGSIPALLIARLETLKLLNGSVSWNKRGKKMSNSFLILQFGIACFFIIGAVVVNKQVNYMLDKSLGFRGDQVINVSFLTDYRNDGHRSSKYEVFKSEIKQLKGVNEVGTSTLTFGGNNRGGVFGTSYTKGQETYKIDNVMIDDVFFDMLEIKLKEGRMLSPTLASDSLDNIVVNEAFVHTMNLNKPLGTSLETNGQKKMIVGVIHDFNFSGLEKEVIPHAYYYMKEGPHSYGMFSMVYIKVSPNDITKTIAEIEKIWKKHNTGDKDVFSYEFVDKQFQETFTKVQMEKKIFNVLSCFVVFIALFGLFAVASFTIGTRLREVAIRKVLGAETTGLLRQLSFQYVIYCLIGFGIAIFPSYYFLSKWLENYAYHIEIGWDIYVFSLLLILGLTLLIVISRAYKATRVDVLKYIKYE